MDDALRREVPCAQVLAERDGDTNALLARYTYGDDLISQTRGAATSQYHYDGQMSTRQLSDGSAGAKKRQPGIADRYIAGLVATVRIALP